MELRRIVINKEIIIQKLSSNKNITKKYQKITKRMDCSINKGEEYSFCESVTECQNLPKENIHQRKTKQIDKNEDNINKQLIEIRHNNRKNYLQSKNLGENRN